MWIVFVTIVIVEEEDSGEDTGEDLAEFCQRRQNRPRRCRPGWNGGCNRPGGCSQPNQQMTFGDVNKDLPKGNILKRERKRVK